MEATLMDGERKFGALLESVLRARCDEATTPVGLEQRLKARLAQESSVAQVPLPFAFVQRVKTGRSAASLWTALLAHAAILLMVLTLVSKHVALTKPTQIMAINLASPPPLPKSLTSIGGGGGAHDVAPATQGRLPKLAQTQILSPKAPPTIAPKLAVEPSVVVQPDLKMANNSLPNLGMPNAPAASIGSLGTGSGGGIGGGIGNGIGMGSGGNMGGGIYKVGGGVLAPRLIRQVDAEFSEEARKAKFSGNVVVGLIVDEQGNPTHVRVLHGVGMGLDDKAVEAVRQYRFKPSTKDGKPVKVEVSIDVNFQIF